MTENIPLIRSLLSSPRRGEEIEAMSFAIIDREAPAHDFTPEQWEIVRRMVHASGDFRLMQDVRFSAGAVASGIRALAESRPVYVDANMIKAGLSLPRLRRAGANYTPDRILCRVADPDVASDAERESLPRSLFAVRRAKHALQDGIAVFGNSPVALLELNRMIMEEGLRPALVVAMPVGFVHVRESKAELMRQDVPFIALDGRRGGSTLAVSVIHALCGLAAGAAERPLHPEKPVREAVVIIGHGSRRAGASKDMEKIARRIRTKLGGGVIETCSMSMSGPYFPEAFSRCLEQGAQRIIVLPYFLHAGVHIHEDIPAMLREKAAEFPGIEIILGKTLGYDELLVDLVIRRVQESRGLDDIRNIGREEVHA
jgi:precorrin isomerase